MIRKSILLLLVVLFGQGLFAQNVQQDGAKLSPLTKKYLLESGKKGANGVLSKEFIYKKIAGNYYLSAILKVNESIDAAAVSDLHVLVGTKAGNIWTAQIPFDKLGAFTKLKGIDYIQLDEPVFLSLDSARHDTHVDSVHKGYNLPQAYTGKNIVVGIIDAGFDYTHPTMMDTTGTRYRVKKVWEQKTSGTPPSGYSYGNELPDSSAIWQGENDISLFSHGTHVTGIAAGSGVGSSADNHRFRGCAFESDIVLVGIRPDTNEWTSTGVSSIIDGMAYIFNYATSVGKPAVVNLSWGCSMGPHDGSSLFSQAVDNLTGPGRIFVCAAGNNGADNIHLKKIFRTSDTLLESFVTFSSLLGSRRTWVDAWGQASKSFCASVTLYSGNTVGNTTGFICLDDSIHTLYLRGVAGDTCFVTITTSASDFNGKPRIFFDFYSKTSDRIMIKFKSTDGTVNVWMGYVKDYEGYYGSFSAGGQVLATTGNRDMTISDFSSTHSAIGVAAYASKVNYMSIDGAPTSYSTYVSEGKLAPFSSHGPDADSATKPDIAAPGLILGSGINSYDTTYNTGGPYRSDVITCYTSPINGRNYCYAMMMGTSMASPMTTGIVALMLEADPLLSPELVKDLIWSTAIRDTFTGTLPATGSFLWGYGKINAYAAVKKAWQTANVNNIANEEMNFMIYPNPNHGNFAIDYISEMNDAISISIYDLCGRLVCADKWMVGKGYNNRKFDVSAFGKGIYFAKIVATRGDSMFKMVVE